VRCDAPSNRNLKLTPEFAVGNGRRIAILRRLLGFWSNQLVVLALLGDSKACSYKRKAPAVWLDHRKVSGSPHSEKRCTISALFNEGDHIWILDGINNEGFSGGPVIFGTGADQRIIPVISGYVSEPADVISALHATSTPQATTPDHRRQTVNLNSGSSLLTTSSTLWMRFIEHRLGRCVG
jgi:hypothetical protein